jgi:hypothetical protein
MTTTFSEQSAGRLFGDVVGPARSWECASHEIEAAPASAIFVRGIWGGRRQTIRIDPEEVDELARRLHQAKRYVRGGR